MAIFIGAFRLFFSAFLLSLLNAASIGINSAVEELLEVRERARRDASTLGQPTQIHRAKISMVGTKVMMGDSRSVTQMFDIYQYRVSWTEPTSWNDNFDDSSRRYELNCWVEGGNGDRKTIVRKQVGAYFSGYNQKYRFPPGLDLATQCQVRANNSAGFTTSWTETNRISVKDVPVYFPGFEDVDLRGLSEEGIISVLSKNSTEVATESVVPSETSTKKE
uniref:Uncharacterized protein n=1 Tax=Plectus sambesii TaxID=2011161 RepID=A0A914V1X6_9BILA